MKRNFPFKTILYALSVALVLLFQAYWLNENYQLKKANFLRSVETAVQEKLDTMRLKNLTGSLSLNGAGAANFDLGSMLDKKYTPRENDSLSKLFLKSYKQSSSISLNISNLQKFGDQKSDDSIIYYYLKNAIPELKNRKIIVYSQSIRQAQLHSYPHNESLKKKDTTQEIYSRLSIMNGFRVYINGLAFIVLKKMLGVFIFSLIYLTLFIATVFLLLSAANQKRKLLESKNSFTQNMTHELKIPISTLYLIKESFGSYKNTDLPNGMAQTLDTMSAALDRLSGMVDKILTNARLGSRKVKLNREPVNIRALINAALESLGLEFKQVTSCVDYSQVPADAFTYADFDQMVSVFINLIENAIKYCDKSPHIIISLKTTGDLHFIYVADNGYGIPKKYFNDIFQPYFRVPEKDLHNVKGYGLGLSVVQQIIDMHGGHIRVLTSGAGGTTIEIKMVQYDY